MLKQEAYTVKSRYYALSVYTDKGRICWAYIWGAYIRGRRRGNYIREEKHFNLQSVKFITFLSFFYIL